MSSGTHVVKVALDGTGAGSNKFLVHGEVTALRVERSSGSPVVTVVETSGTDEILLNGVTVAADTTYTPHKQVHIAAGTTVAFYAPYSLAGSVTVTVTSGAASGTVTVLIKVK